MPKTSGFVCLRPSIFKTILCHEIVDIVFLFRMSPSCRLGFSSRLVFCYFDEVARRGVVLWVFPSVGAWNRIPLGIDARPEE